MASENYYNTTRTPGMVMFLKDHHIFLNNPHWKCIICFCCSCNEKHYTLPFSITELKIELNQLSNWQLNIPGTVYSIAIWLRMSRWCNHTKRLCDCNSTVWKLDYIHANFGYSEMRFRKFPFRNNVNLFSLVLL